MSDRTVATDALATLGTIIDDNQKRDAIHLAVMPVMAGMDLSVGDDIGLIDGLATNKATKKLGIVDPFLKEAVQEGQRFWLVIYPRVITSLRHVWSHPAFPDEQVNQPTTGQRDESRKWLEAFATRLFSYEPDYGARFDVLMRNAESGYFGTDIEYGEDCTPNDEFWMHYERYTGRKVINPPDHFRCAC